MLPEIPDNDSGVCWARGCGDPAGGIHTGLCFVHNQRIRSHLQEGREITAHVFDLLGLRLNVLEETGGACLRASGPCDLRICRYHLDDAGTETAREHQDLSEPCAVKLAGNGTLTLMVSGFFEGDPRKVEAWFSTPNPLFGGTKPIDLARIGRSHMLLAVVRQALAENSRA